MSARARTGLLALGALAAGAAAGVAAEELLFRRSFRTPGPDAAERFGSVRGRTVVVTSFDGTPLAVETFGPDDAPAVVLMHGVLLTRDIWHYQLRELSKRYRVIAYDARGHGASGPPHGPAGLTRADTTTLAKDLRAVLDAMGLTDAVLVGHSMGGMTVLAFAGEFPSELGSRVRGIVLLTTTFTSAIASWRQDRVKHRAVREALGKVLELAEASPRAVSILRFPANDLALLMTRVAFGSQPSAAHVALVHEMLSQTRSESMAAALTGLRDYHHIHVLPKISVPALVIGASRDLVTPVWLSREMAKRIPAAELIVHRGSGHMVMLERHDELNEELVDFLDRTLHPADSVAS